ncbi:hypothetical protein H310_11830 [Aphanomyces invadans]|uniref:Uncharacterized protein n=1 Tax=Aphanomyces invadans TaxID=157072 RepID=A0A024TK50_9STRA|nr:hypothetical protein H310_11830 [Aphanomyces invadans]ETV94530.1 hypothetical protein H310_11830 [Aphanomyces invadans]|eukprot:XP_008876845.1 hypothetical protein H310_11830 [Aphanomyces invadans]
MVNHKALPREALTDLAITFNVDRSIVRRLWNRASVDLTNHYRVGVDSDTNNDGFNLLYATDMDEKVEELALEISKAMEVYEFSSQMKKLADDEELDDDIDADLANILSL